MRKDIDKFQLLLIRPDDVEVGYLNHSNLVITNTSPINRISQISFKLPEYINTNTGEKVVNPYYNVAKSGFKIKLTIDNQEKGTYERMFKISRPQEFTDGTKTSIVYSAYSYETVLNQKSIPSFAGVAVDVDGNTGVSIDVSGNVTYTPIDTIDIVDYTLDGVDIAEVSISILYQTGSAWEVDFIDPALIDILRSDINIGGTNALNALKSLQGKYGAVISFDTINKKVRYYKLDNLGDNLGLSVEYGKYLKSLNRDERVDEIITRVKVVGKDDVGIGSVSYTGQNYVEDYTYFLGSFDRTGSVVNVSSEWMSDSLALAISDYNDTIDTKKPSLDILLAEKDVILTNILNLEINLIYLTIGQDLVEEHLIINDTGLGKVTLSDGVRIKDAVGGVGLVEALVGGEYINIPYSGGIPASVVGNTYRFNTQTIDGEEVPYYGSSELFFNLTEYPVGTNIRISYRNYGKAEIDDTINAYQSYLATGTPTSSQITTLEAIIAVLNTSRDAQIVLINSDESDLETERANLVIKDAQIEVIQDLLSIDANFTTAQLEEWENFIVEYTYQNNTISDPDLLLIAAQEVLDDRKYPEVIITLDMISLLQTEDARVDWDKVNLYDYINIYFDRLNIDVQAKIMEITIDVDNNDMNLIISTTKDYIKDNNRLLQKAIKVISDTSENVKFNHVKWNGSIHNTDLLASFEEEGIETEDYNILGSNNNSVITDETGMTIVEKVVINADWNPLVNIPAAASDSKYGDRFVRIANGGIYLTSDGGKTFKTAITAGQIYADVIKGELLVGSELQILGNDGSDDIVSIGNVLTSDFGIVINGEVDSKPTVVSMTRDAGFHITYDSVDVFGINATGILQAKGISLYRDSGQLLLNNDKLVADYVQGDLKVGGNLSITGNDSVSDILLIGDILTTDFGIQIDSVVSGNDIRMIMARDEGFKIEVDTGSGYEDRFSVNSSGVIEANGIKILDIVHSGKVLLSNDYMLQTLSLEESVTEILAHGDSFDVQFLNFSNINGFRDSRMYLYITEVADADTLLNVTLTSLYKSTNTSAPDNGFYSGGGTIWNENSVTVVVTAKIFTTGINKPAVPNRVYEVILSDAQMAYMAWKGGINVNIEHVDVGKGNVKIEKVALFSQVYVSL